MSFIHWLAEIKAFLQYGDLPTRYYVKRGMKVGKNFSRQTGTRLDPSNCWLIEIGDDVRISNRVQILAHDFSTMHYTGYVRFGRVVIGNRVWIGAGATILMNVHIGNDVVIGAGSLVNKDVPDGCVVAGVPAKVICSTDEYVEKQKQLLSKAPQYDKKDTFYSGKMTKQKQLEILRALDESPNGVFYAKFRDFRRLIGSGEIEKI
jgi:maltose O-acetyltransferase